MKHRVDNIPKMAAGETKAELSLLNYEEAVNLLVAGAPEAWRPWLIYVKLLNRSRLDAARRAADVKTDELVQSLDLAIVAFIELSPLAVQSRARAVDSCCKMWHSIVLLSRTTRDARTIDPPTTPVQHNGGCLIM